MFGFEPQRAPAPATLGGLVQCDADRFRVVVTLTPQQGKILLGKPVQTGLDGACHHQNVPRFVIPTAQPCWYHADTIRRVAMTLRLTDDQAAALRARAEREGRSMQQVAVAALDDYLLRAEDDELTDRLTAQGAERFADLLRRLGE